MIMSRSAIQFKNDKLTGIKLLGSRLLTRSQDIEIGFLQRLMLRKGELNVIARFSDTLDRLVAGSRDSGTYIYASMLKAVD